MACATLKRSYDFDPVLSPQHQSLSKRRRCSPMNSSPQESGPSTSAFLEATPKVSHEELSANVKDEWRRMQRRKKLLSESPINTPTQPSEGSNQSQVIGNFQHLSTPFAATWACQPLGSSWTSPSSSPPRDGACSPLRRSQPTFTVRQVVLLCERLWKEREEKLREEYDKVLNNRLAEQYDAFLKFTQDQIMRRYQESSCSYVS